MKFSIKTCHFFILFCVFAPMYASEKTNQITEVVRNRYNNNINFKADLNLNTAYINDKDCIETCLDIIKAPRKNSTDEHYVPTDLEIICGCLPFASTTLIFLRLAFGC